MQNFHQTCGHGDFLSKPASCERQMAYSVTNVAAPTMVTLYSSYLGPVTVTASYASADLVLLQGPVQLGSRAITCKVLSVVEYGLDINARYRYDSLVQARAQRISKAANLMCYRNILKFRRLFHPEEGKKITRFERNLPPSDSSAYDSLRLSLDELQTVQRVLAGAALKTDADVIKVYNKLLNFNSGVDCLFHTQQYLTWLYTVCGQVGVNTPQDHLITLNGFVEDNAFFTGEYLAICQGKSVFFDMATADVVAHEVTHGLVQALAGLEYQDESGAMNEAMADAFGVAYEDYLYKKFNTDADESNDILGESDWVVGEDQARQLPWLRNMEDPTDAVQPQPKMYKGEYWATGSDDYGGVHTNSGVLNHCFYLLSRSVGITTAVQAWYKCLRQLRPKSGMLEFAQLLLQQQSDLGFACRDALIGVDLLQATDEDLERKRKQEEDPNQDEPQEPEDSNLMIDIPAFQEPMVMITRKRFDELVAASV